jgi:excisionase family DNA binding protein
MSGATTENISIDNVRKTMTVSECAAVLGIGKKVIYTKAKEDKLPFKHMTIGRSILISKKSFYEYAESMGL